MKTKLIALTTILCFIFTSINAQIGPIDLNLNSDSIITLKTIKVDTIEVMKETNLNGKVFINNSLDLSGKASLDNVKIYDSLAVEGKATFLNDIVVDKGIQLTLDNSENGEPYTWLRLTDSGVVKPGTPLELLDEVFGPIEFDYSYQCSSLANAPNVANGAMPYWGRNDDNLFTDQLCPGRKYYVGIGTKTPNQTLDVKGVFQVKDLSETNFFQLKDNTFSFSGNEKMNILNTDENSSIAIGTHTNPNHLIVNGETTLKSSLTVESGAGISDNLIVGQEINAGDNITTEETIKAKNGWVTNRLGIGAQTPKGSLQIGESFLITSGAINNNLYHDGNSKYLTDGGKGSRLQMTSNTTFFQFFDESQTNKSADDVAENSNYPLQIKFNRVGVNYGWTNDPPLKAAFNIKGYDTNDDLLLVEDNTGDDKFKVASDGITYAKEIKIQLGEFPDYVFEKDYNLPSLKEVESHINENGHLPNIPSAAEVDKNGIGVGELQIKLLEKVEELTLYILEQQKQIEQQQKEIEILKSQSK